MVKPSTSGTLSKTYVLKGTIESWYTGYVYPDSNFFPDTQEYPCVATTKYHISGTISSWYSGYIFPDHNIFPDSGMYPFP